MVRTDGVGPRRLVNQRIAGERCATPAAVVRWMGAIQAQEYSQALWAIGLRTCSATLADVESVIAERAIVLTWPLRGTLHAAPPEDVRWMLGLSAARRRAADRRRLAQLELDDGIIGRCIEIFHEALQGGRRLTRQTMLALLADVGISPAGQRGYHILWHAALAGVICLGPLEGKQQTFVLLDEWIPASRRLSREEAAAELARRYFTSHGPATSRDFAGWAGISLAEAAAGIEAAKPQLASEAVGATIHWFGRDGAEDAAREPANVHFLPGFDEYMLGYKDRDDVLAPEHADRVVPGKNEVFVPTIVVAGRIVATWQRTLRKGALDITIRPFVALSVARTDLAEAARRYGDFIGVPITSITLEDVR